MTNSDKFNNYLPQTVYKVSNTSSMLITRKCFEKLEQSSEETVRKATGTSANSSLAAPNQRNDLNLNMPKPKQQKLSRSQKTDSKTKTLISAVHVTKSSLTKKALSDWIDAYYNPTHFFTIQYPYYMKTGNSDKSRWYLKLIMSKFERQLLKRHWNKKHLPFIVCAEKGENNSWHHHILFNNGEFTEEKLHNVLYMTRKRLSFLKLPHYAFRLLPIMHDDQRVYDYCTKEMKFYINGNFDSDRIILSHDLFGLPYKTLSIKS